MKTFLHILRFQSAIFRRSGIMKGSLIAILGIGIYSVYFGKFETDKQLDRIATVEDYERQHFDSLLYWADQDTTIAENKTPFMEAISPTGDGYGSHFKYYFSRNFAPTAGLCLGQSDLYPAYYGLDLSDVTRQLNVGELANPLKLFTGNFDISYVVVFLLPLMIVALFYNIHASDKEGGILPLMQSQPIRPSRVFLSKWIVRLAFVLLFTALLLLIAFLLQGISLASHFSLYMKWLGISAVYCLFWAILMAGIVRLRLNSSLSAMLGLATWLLLTLINPSILNIAVSSKAPLPNRAEVIHAVRNLNDSFWESAPSLVYNQFYDENPEYRRDTTDYDKWNYASYDLLDKEANRLKAQLEEQVIARNTLLKKWQWLTPAAMVHEELAKISSTDRESHLRFVDGVIQQHREIKDFYYSRIFEGKKFTKEDLQKLRTKL